MTAAPGFQLALTPGVAIAKRAHTGAPLTALPVPLPANPAQLGLPLAAGESVVSPVMVPGREHVVELALAVPARAPAGVRVLVEYELRSNDPRWVVLGTADLGGAVSQTCVQFGIAALAGMECRFRLRRADSCETDVAVSLLRVCARHERGRLNALTDYDLRLANEVRHFSTDVYSHAMYGAAAAAGSAQVQAARAARADPEAFAAAARRRSEEVLAAFPHASGEGSYDYARRALALLLPSSPPDFLRRAAALSQARPLRVLSVLSGAARIEEKILEHCAGEVDLTLVDASEELVRRAAQRFSTRGGRHRIQCLVGDVNAGLPVEGEYDIVICVSALHHVADLEVLLSHVNQCLKPGGEFWSIGEQVGRNGNRLWPDAYAAANAAFSRLPAHLRRNAHTGRIDEVLGDEDFSLNCFEGIRSEEVQALLEAHLVPVQVETRNAFLWRLVSAAYCDNFVLDDAEDLQELRRLIVAEAVHWACGGRGTELNGIYGKKYVR